MKKTEPAKMVFGAAAMDDEHNGHRISPVITVTRAEEVKEGIKANVHLTLTAVALSLVASLAAIGLGYLAEKAGHKLNVKANADVRSSWAAERNAIANEGIRDALERLADKFAPVRFTLKHELSTKEKFPIDDPFERYAEQTAANTDRKLRKEEAAVLAKTGGKPFDPVGALTSAELKKIKETPGCDEMVYRDKDNVLKPDYCRE